MALPGASRADFPALRRLIYGGAAMPPEKIRQVRAFFGPVLATTYGQTEAPQILTAMRPEDFEDEGLWTSVGRTTWFSDLAIMAPDGRLLPRGEAVSYTHLRAHETGRNLVCRLLLEKKKKK